MKFCRITFTIDAQDAGDEMISWLLDAHWIACAQVSGPIISHYHWNGNRERTEEWKYDLKTLNSGFESVVAFIQEHHPYEVAEILIEECESANPDFSDWIQEECWGLPESTEETEETEKVEKNEKE